MSEAVSASRPQQVAQRPSCGPVEKTATRVGWLKVIIASGVALLAAGAAAAIYASQFATSEQVSSAVKSHVEDDSPHPGIRRDMQSIEQRLIRVETVQQRMETVQQRMDDKLDRLVEGQQAHPWRPPPGSPPSPTP